MLWIIVLLALLGLGLVAAVILAIVTKSWGWAGIALVLAIVLSLLLVWPGWARTAIWPATKPAAKTDILNPCVTGEDPGRQIEPLYENGKVVPNAFMGLDLNRAEVTSGKRYRVLAPAGSYLHLFVAVNDRDRSGDHLTYEVHGENDGVLTVSTAWTLWCAAGNWDKGHAGEARVMNAKNLTPLMDVWMSIPVDGVMPVPPVAVAPAPKVTEAPAVKTTPAPTAKPAKATVACNPGAGWEKQADGSWHIGPLAADKAISFTVPTGGTLHYSYAGKAGTPAKAGEKVTLHEGTLFCPQQ